MDMVIQDAIKSHHFCSCPFRWVHPMSKHFIAFPLSKASAAARPAIACASTTQPTGATTSAGASGRGASARGATSKHSEALKKKRYLKLEINWHIQNPSFSKCLNRQDSSNLGWIMPDHERFMKILSSFHLIWATRCIIEDPNLGSGKVREVPRPTDVAKLEKTRAEWNRRSGTVKMKQPLLHSTCLSVLIASVVMTSWLCN